ncbi:MAG: aldolase/citrate lyase family protein [Acidimicrobiia bacterium]|jgi:citrate lyase subunit beta/citryl-CoA lyase
MIGARSLLFVPGDRAEMLDRASTRGADGLIVDLEDSVAPSRKSVARARVAAWLERSHDPPGEVWVRVSGLETLDQDLREIGPFILEGLVLPKVTSTRDVEIVRARLHEISPTARVVVLIETASALREVDRIAEIPSVSRLMLGDIDLGAELSLPPNSSAWDPIRVALTVASAAAGIEGPVAGVDPDFSEMSSFEAETRHWASLGYTGRAAIHPAQVAPINQVFTPTPQAVKAAEAALAAHEEKLARGRGSHADDEGRMVDEATLRRSRSLIRRAQLAGMDRDTDGPET